MKNIFGIDVTEDKGNTRYDGECFVLRQLPEDMAADLQQVAGEVEHYENQVTLPTFVAILYWVCILVGVSVLLGLLEGGFDLGQVMENAPWALYLGVGAWAVVIAIKLYEAAKLRKTVESEAFESHVVAVEEMCAAARAQLAIPEDCPSIDVIVTKHRIRNGTDKQVNVHPMYENWVLDMFVFREGDMLCLGDFEKVYGIPLAALGEMTRSKRRAMFPTWNKEEPWNAAAYKPYKVRMNNQGCYFVLYDRVAVVTAAGEFELLIPNYDQRTFTEALEIEN